ncbi:MAG TPA: bifunctional glycosyltransferase/class I SAM-dependent methyltransferase [Candidatus Limnocylindrales bacterium]|nr:bifunctional glycosyltransferase/class I SAM-dependent methyltransferase [Candidatus Limnocylindrales bacterium]
MRTPVTSRGTEENRASRRPAPTPISSGGSNRKRTSTTLSVIVPAYNEQFLVATSLGRLRVLSESQLLGHVKVIVVDDGSSDSTWQSISEFRATIPSEEHDGKFSWAFLRHEKNAGKGAAIRTGLEQVDTELVVIHDADLEYHPHDLLSMVEVFLYEDADAVFGSRFMPGGYKRALFFKHALGNSLLTFLCDLVCDLNLTDMETCYKMVKANLLKSIPLESKTFDVEPELAIKLAKRGARIFEVPISYSGRTYREGKKIGWKDGIRALWAILHYAVSDKLYTADAYGAEILGRLNRAPKFTRWMADVIRPYLGNRVLEIGAGIGNMSVHLMPRPSYWATDVNPHYLDYLVGLRTTRPYMQVAQTDATDERTYPEGQSFDTVVCLNVVEHLQDDVGALRNIWNVLEDDGRAIILVPYGPKLYGTLDEVLGHYRRYTEDQLVDASQQAGFRVEQVLKFNRPGVAGWWLNGKVLKRRTFGLGQIKMLNFLTPLFRLLDSWIPLPPLSIIAILRKEHNNAGISPDQASAAGGGTR